MKIFKIDETNEFERMESNSYILLKNTHFLIIDPSMPLKKVESVLNSQIQSTLSLQGNINPNPSSFSTWVHHTPPTNRDSLVCDGVCITHCHADHIAFLNEYINAGITVYLSQQTFDNLLLDGEIDYAEYVLGHKLKLNINEMKYKIIDEQTNKIGSFNLKVKKTPGHTNDSICLYNDSDIFVGDLAFSGGGIGRVDLPTGNMISMAHSIKWLKSLPKDLICHGGHGADFTIENFINKVL